MGRKNEPVPGQWAIAVNLAVKAMLKEKRVSGRLLSELIDRSNGYVAARLRLEAAFTLTDMEAMGNALDFDPGQFIAGVTFEKCVEDC
jgi:hypothetical protein